MTLSLPSQEDEGARDGRHGRRKPSKNEEEKERKETTSDSDEEEVIIAISESANVSLGITEMHMAY